MFEGEVSKVVDDESSESEDEWEEVEMVGEKQKASDIFNDLDVEELINIEEEASLEAVTKSEQLWKEFFEQVHNYNLMKTPFKLIICIYRNRKSVNLQNLAAEQHIQEQDEAQHMPSKQSCIKQQKGQHPLQHSFNHVPRLLAKY